MRFLLALAAIWAFAIPPAQAGILGLFGHKKELAVSADRKSITFETNGETIAAEEVTLMVPENRADPDSRTIAVRFVRLPAVEPTGLPPVVYLAGGPGGSATGTAKGGRWPLFDAMRQVTDVILFDQRGTGLSDRPTDCESSIGFGPGTVSDRETVVALYEMAFAECEAFWEAAGVDLHGYNTLESADDLAAVAEHLGGRVSLVGISYGTHLALAAIKTHPDKIDRAVLASVEGLDQTVKMPGGVDAYLARLQAAIDTQPGAKALYPDIAGAARRVVERLRDEPVTVTIRDRGGSQAGERVLGPFLVQMVISYSVSDPERTPALLAGIKRADEDEDYSYFARWAGWLLEEKIELAAMSTGMDIASGVSRGRLRKIRSQAEKAVVGDAHNFPMPHLLGAGQDYVLPKSFRKRPRGKTPILVLSGTLDGRTFPNAAKKATRDLKKNRTIVTVQNGGHNIFLDHPDIVPLVVDYLEGDDVPTRTITAALPDFAPEDN